MPGTAEVQPGEGGVVQLAGAVCARPLARGTRGDPRRGVPGRLGLGEARGSAVGRGALSARRDVLTVVGAREVARGPGVPGLGAPRGDPPPPPPRPRPRRAPLTA